MATVVWASVKSGDDFRRRTKSGDGGAAVNYGASAYEEESPVRVQETASGTADHRRPSERTGGPRGKVWFHAC